MTLYRPHRAFLDEAMKEKFEVKSFQDILDYYKRIGFPIKGKLTCEWYSFDKRIDWDTWIVCEDGQAIGFTNGPIES
jgi:hypothetical protein